MTANYWRLQAALMTAALVAVSGTVFAQAPQSSTSDHNAVTSSRTNPPAATEGYLGVSVEPLHPSLLGHLASLLREGRGIIVEAVAPASPAEKSGLQPNDIIVSFNEQNLYAPLQFSQLVRYAKPGSEVTLGIVRAGHMEQIKVTLGEQQVSAMPRRAFRMPLVDRPWTAAARERSGGNWTRFDSLNLSRLDGTHFKAEINFRNSHGKLDTRTFQGTREEIRRDIEAQQDLPAEERDHLLRTLDLPRGEYEFELPDVRYESP